MRLGNRNAMTAGVVARHKGFTLVELLVVIAIIGILVSLLLPAVQSAREAARRSQCTNNLKQLALACLNYESTYERLPPGCDGWGNDDGFRGRIGTSWAIEILPFLEQPSLYDAYDFTSNRSYRSTGVNPSGQTNVRVSQALLDAFLCPSDTIPRQTVALQGEEGRQFAPTSYKAVAGVIDTDRTGGTAFYWDRWYGKNGTPSEPNDAAVQNIKTYSGLRGPFTATGGQYPLRPTRLAQITDGQSKTVLIGEYHSATDLPERKGAWGGSWRYWNKAHIIRGSAFRTPDIDDCIEIAGAAGLGGGDPQFNCFRAFASLHLGGTINFALADGSVAGISSDIDDEVYLLLGSIAGGLDNGPLEAGPAPPPPPPPPR